MLLRFTTFVASVSFVLSSGAVQNLDSFHSNIGELKIVTIKKFESSLADRFKISIEEVGKLDSTTLDSADDFLPAVPEAFINAEPGLEKSKITSGDDTTTQPAEFLGDVEDNSSTFAQQTSDAKPDDFNSSHVDTDNFPQSEESISESSIVKKGEVSDVLPFLTSDFFAGSLSGVETTEDPMGTQRLLQVKNSQFSPSSMGGVSSAYSSNPDQVKEPIYKDAISVNVTAGFNLGLGEYGLGDYFICAPGVSFLKMRTYSDPTGKFHHQSDNIAGYKNDYSKTRDVDTLIVGLSAPFAMPNDYLLTLSYNYSAPSTFRGQDNLISYSNTPSITLSRNFPLENGNSVMIALGASYTFSKGDDYAESTNSGMLGNSLGFLDAYNSTGGPFSARFPEDKANNYAFSLSCSYSMVLSDKILLSPSSALQVSNFTKGDNDGRVDTNLQIGISGSYAFRDWLSFSLFSQYSTKWSNREESHFENVSIGGGLNANHSF